MKREHFFPFLVCFALLGAYKTNLEPLKCSLRKAVRVIDFAKYQAHSEPLFKKYNLLNFDNMYKLEVAKFMFDICHENSSDIFNDLFIKTNLRHHHMTRQSSNDNFSLPLVSTNYKQRSIIYEGVKIWNSLPLRIKKLENKPSFTKKLKNYFLESN